MRKIFVRPRNFHQIFGSLVAFIFLVIYGFQHIQFDDKIPETTSEEKKNIYNKMNNNKKRMKGNFLLFYCIINFDESTKDRKGGRLSEEAQYGSNEGSLHIKHRPGSLACLQNV